MIKYAHDYNPSNSDQYYPEPQMGIMLVEGGKVQCFCIFSWQWWIHHIFRLQIIHSTNLL